MTRKVYRTAQGKMVDLGRLQLQYEDTRAVGNMGVNARGDLVDSRNRTIERRTATVQRQYNQQTIAKKAARSQVPTNDDLTLNEVDVPAPPEDFEDNFTKVEVPQPTSGLAAAIAKAREIRQEPLRSPQQTAKQQEGVQKL